jgi:hypothetical protein
MGAFYFYPMNGNSKLTERQIKWVLNNMDRFTTQQIADKFNTCRSTIRQIYYKNGRKKIILEKWTKEQTDFVLNNYKKMGDKEIAYQLNLRFPKVKKFDNKAIEKKRTYLKITRTAEELAGIKKRTVEVLKAYKHGKTWKTRGELPQGTIKTWKQTGTNAIYYFKVIKIGKQFINYARYLWEQANGPIPKGYCVCFKDGNSLNCELSNLQCITRQEKEKIKTRYGNQFKNIELLIDQLKSKAK